MNSAPQYELDHFINELQKTSPNGKSVDHIENLIFACRNCNQAKKEFDTKKIIGIVHPDGENIKKVFERDNYYKIVISQEYLNNEQVKSFYSKMKFDYAYRKLDYLLLNLYFTKNNKKDRIYNRLLELRNSFPSLNKLQ
ncbi:HNH endonuclease [Streptococcus salivarius]|uniref:HNH endonuclease n=1 Tax=Streptococcus salivarius TaxID=1304 RepID=UPI00397BB4CD